jgi:hypothetical protein
VDLYIHSPIRLRGVVLDYLSTGTTLPFFTCYRNIMLITTGLILKKLAEIIHNYSLFDVLLFDIFQQKQIMLKICSLSILHMIPSINKELINDELVSLTMVVLM